MEDRLVSLAQAYGCRHYSDYKQKLELMKELNT